MRLGEAEPAWIAPVRRPRNSRPVPNAISTTALTLRLPAPPAYGGALVVLQAATGLTWQLDHSSDQLRLFADCVLIFDVA